MRRLTLVLAHLLALASCEGSDIGNPGATMELALYNQGTGAAPTVTDAWIAVHRLSIFGTNDCTTTPAVNVPAGSHSLLTEDPLPFDMGRALDAGDYCRMELVFGVDAAEGPPELAGVSLFVSGTRGDGTPFLVRSVQTTTPITFGGAGSPFTIQAGTTGVILGFDAAVLFANVDLAAATVSADGIIHIETGTNDTQLTAFETALHSSSHLFHDDDHDGHLDDTEHDPTHSIVDGH